MIRSMTGFGAADGEVGGGRVSVEVRSVNHRFFSPSIKLPGTLIRWEGEVRDALKRGVTRGHVTLSARFERDEDLSAASPIDETRFGAYVAQLRELQQRHGLADTLDVGTVLRMPEVFAGSVREEMPPEAGAQLVAIVDRAVVALLAMRGAEGARLVSYLDERLEVIERALDRIAVRAPERVLEQRDRLRTAVRELTDGLAVDETRLAQEIALLADRLDVQEELSRFRAHIAAFRAALGAAQPDGVGKRLGFLLQEMLREANTTGSKGNDAAIVADVLQVKEELERIREQVENLE
ncbi:MAG TPA: YicC/YloC family endoribonuclease [Gemmatimonadaceae bacterium]|nr:YicC/YloC family endoribonuclease [Gemmatimonadaceae bacterium]